MKKIKDQKNKKDLSSAIHVIEIQNTAKTESQISILLLFFDSKKNHKLIDHIIVESAKII